MPNTSNICWLCLFILPLFYSCGQDQEETAPPNILFIFPDQFRQFSLGFWSQSGNDRYLPGKPDPVSTPNLDKLAGEGIVFNRSVSNFPLCSPYRGMLLSGMYPDQNGATNNCRAGREVKLKAEAECMTDVFAAAGYEVAYFGKCHWQRTEPLFDESGKYVGTTEAPGGHYVNRYDTYVPPGPDRHGIGYFFQTLKDDHFHPICYSNDPAAINGLPDGTPYRPERFSSELEAEVIMDYLSNTREQRDPDKPFFLMWSLNPPHNPWTEESTYMEFFDQYTESSQVDLNKLVVRANADTTVADYAPYYYANVSAVDHFVGRVLDHLETLGLADNTIIVFSSDHGEMLGSHGRIAKNVPETESLFIPFVIKWGDRLKHRVEDLILSVPDVMPTLLGLAGLEERIPASVQGVDYSRTLANVEDGEQVKPRSALYFQNAARGVYTGQYTFVVREENGKFREAFCYDNEEDPYQLNRIPAEQMEAATVQMLRKELYDLLRETDDRWYREGIGIDFLLSE